MALETPNALIAEAHSVRQISFLTLQRLLYKSGQVRERILGQE